MRRATSFLPALAAILFWMVVPFGVQCPAAPTAVETPFVKGTFRALIIGNNDYTDPEGLWIDLKSPISDAEAVAALLQEKYGFDPQNILLLKNGTRAGILSAFSQIAKASQENDSVFIFYAGHGYADPDTQEAFWIPVDAVGKEDYTYVRNSTIKSKLTVIADRAKHVFMVSDSCFSGTLLREGHRGLRPTEKTDQYYQKVAQKKSVQVLSAGGLEYVDDNYKETGHSPFTFFLLEQMGKSTEPYYSATELCLEVAKAVSKNVHQTPEKGVLHGAGDSNGEFFFRQAPGKTLQPSAGASPVPKGASKPESFDAEAEMWALVKDSGSAEDIQSFLAAFPEGKLTPVARLKLQQLERVHPRGNASPQAPTSVAAVSQPSAPGQGKTLAIFPAKFQNHGKKAYGKSLPVISTMVDNAKGFGRIVSYYPLVANRSVAPIPPDMNTQSLWTKGSLFSLPEPDLEGVVQEAKGLGADAVLMHYLNVEKEGCTMVAFVIDIHRKKIHSARETGAEWRLEGHHVTQRITKQAFEGYRSEQ